MRPPPCAGRESLNQLGQFARRFERMSLTLAHYRLCDTTRISLVTKFPKNLCQRFRIFAVHQVSRRQRLPRVHPHVQWTVLLETESACRGIQLLRTHTQIQQHTVAAIRCHPFRKSCEISTAQLETAGIF